MAFTLVWQGRVQLTPAAAPTTVRGLHTGAFLFYQHEDISLSFSKTSECTFIKTNLSKNINLIHIGMTFQVICMMTTCRSWVDE